MKIVKTTQTANSQASTTASRPELTIVNTVVSTMRKRVPREILPRAQAVKEAVKRTG